MELAVLDLTGGQTKLLGAEYRPTGRLPIIDQGQALVAGYTDDETAAYSGPLPVVLFGDHTRSLKYMDRRFALGADGVKVIAPKPEYLAKFIYFFWLSRPLRSLGYSRHFKLLREIEIPQPHPDEQARIVELLDQADALRRQRAEADTKLARLLPALFRHHFGDPAKNNRDWPTELLTKICEPRQWPTISQKDLTKDGYIVYGANGPIGFYSSYNHEDPTVLITCRGATCGTINVSPPKCYVTGNAMSLDNPDSSKTTNEFLEVYLRARGLNDTITGAAQPQITRANLSVVNVFTPPMPLVKRFSAQVRDAKQIHAHAAASAAKLESLFQTLLHRAFTGELTAKWREAHLREGLQEMSRLSRA